MSSAQTAVASSQTISLPRAEYDALQAQVQTLQTQLDWFKRQLFGAKSEKRLEQGRFLYRSGNTDKTLLSWTQLKLILEGIELKNTRQYKRFQCSARGH